MKWWAISGGAVLVIAAFSVWVGRGCSAAKQDAEETVANFYAAMAIGDFEAAAELHHPQLIEQSSHEQLIADLEHRL